MITKLENKFEEIKERFSKEEILLIFAKFETEDLLEEIDVDLCLLKDITQEDEIKCRLIVLKKQVREFYELIEDMIEMRRTHNL